MRLQVGQRYRAIGPRPDAKPAHYSESVSGWWEPAEVEVVAVDEAAGVYRTKGTRQAAPVIAFGAEHFWEAVA